MNESSSEEEVEEEEKEPLKAGTKRRRLSNSVSSNNSKKRRRTTSEGSVGNKRQRANSLSSLKSESSGTGSKVRKTAEEWMTDKILTEEDFKRIEDKRLEWLMAG